VKNRIFFKLVLVFALVIAAATLTLDVTITHVWENSLRRQIESNLRQKTAMFASRVAAAQLSAADMRAVAKDIAETSGARATVIDKNGQVLADSGATPEIMAMAWFCRMRLQSSKPSPPGIMMSSRKSAGFSRSAS